MQNCPDLLFQVTFSAHSEKDWARVKMNVAARQEKEEEKKTGKRREKTVDGFQRGACCPSVVQRAARRKNSLCKGSVWGNWDPRKVQQPFLPNPNEVGDRTTTFRRLLIGAAERLFVSYVLQTLVGNQ